MKVSSPVGDFPFEVHRLRTDGAELVVEGAMGAWPATVRVSSQDAPMLLRLVPRPLLIGVIAIACTAVLRAAVRRRQ